MNTNPHIACRLYSAKVYFFCALHDELKKEGVRFDIEVEYDAKIPDFVIHSGEKTVIEHKSSLPRNEDLILKEIEECHRKYSGLIKDGITIKPKVILAFPKTCEDGVKSVLGRVKWDVCILIFNLNEEKEKLTFEKVLGDIENGEVKRILLNREIEFEVTKFSTVKFLREEPHPVYTSCQIWHLFKTFVSPTLTEEYFDVDLDSIIKNFSPFCPKWIHNREQLTRERLKKAFDFLKKIDYITHLPNDKVRIFYKKGNRLFGKDLGEFFSNKWEEIENSKAKEISKKQKTLAEYKIQ